MRLTGDLVGEPQRHQTVFPGNLKMSREVQKALENQRSRAFLLSQEFLRTRLNSRHHAVTYAVTRLRLL
jgi:hypothetical protein